MLMLYVSAELLLGIFERKPKQYIFVLLGYIVYVLNENSLHMKSILLMKFYYHGLI
jgi:hypothetical protein